MFQQGKIQAIYEVEDVIQASWACSGFVGQTGY